jgi:hypothetical protein
MIDFECPHCKRTLKIPERYIGMEGACKFCGGRILIPADSTDALGDAFQAAPSRQGAGADLSERPWAAGVGAKTLQNQLAQARSEIERLARSIETERAARVEAEAARDAAETRARRLEEKLTAVNHEEDVLSLRAAFDRAESQLTQSRVDVERLAKLLETERVAKVEAEIARDVAQIRARRLEENLAAGQDPWDFAMLRAEIERTEAQLAQNQLDVQRFANELETERGARALAKAADRQDAGPAGPPETVPAPEEARRVSRAGIGGVLAGIVCVIVVLFLGIVALPAMKPVRDSVRTAAGAPIGSSAARPIQPSASSPSTGDLEVAVAYVVPSAEQRPAPNVPIVIARERFNREAFGRLIEEAGVAPDTRDAFSDWYCLGPAETGDARLFRASEVPEDAPFALERKQIAALADRIGRDVFETRLLDVLTFDSPAEWTEYTSSAAGVVTVTGLAPGRYATQVRPEGGRDSWPPLDRTKKDLDIITVRAGDRAKTTLKLVDSVSAIRGKVLDSNTGKPVARVPLLISGEAAVSTNTALITTDDGTFAVGPLDAGYGAFVIHCDPLPKGFVAASSFSGTREPGVAQEPIILQLSKKPLPRPGRKGGVSGRVLNPDGTPAPGFGIWMITEDGSARSVARSDRDGAYAFDHPGGPIRLYASGPGSARTEAITIDLQPNQSATRDFVLPQTGRIVLTIRKPDGQPPETFDECSLVTPTRVTSDPTMMRREGDRFAIPYLVQGVYVLTFRVAGYKPVTLPGIEINNDGSDREISINLEAAE